MSFSIARRNYEVAAGARQLATSCASFEFAVCTPLFLPSLVNKSAVQLLPRNDYVLFTVCNTELSTKPGLVDINRIHER